MLVLLFGVTLLRINQIVTLVCLALDRFELVDGAHLLKLRRLMLDRCVMQVAAGPASYHGGTQ
jgi:hypothetical protein